MKKLKPLSTKKPPLPAEDHQLILGWIDDVRPSLNPVVAMLDELIRKYLASPKYAIKWGKAYYGNDENGWCIELVAYDISVNIVFLNGARLDRPPKLGEETRYIKVKNIDEAQSPVIETWIKQSCRLEGWRW